MSVKCGQAYSFIKDISEAEKLREKVEFECKIPYKITTQSEHMDEGIMVTYDVVPFKECYNGSEEISVYEPNVARECTQSLNRLRKGESWTYRETYFGFGDNLKIVKE